MRPARPRLLAEGSQGAREGVNQRGVEASNIDAELEGVSGRDAEEIAGEQASLCLSTIGGCVTGAVWGDPILQVAQPVGRPAVDQFGALPASGKDDGVLFLAHQIDEQIGGLGHRAASSASFRILERRIPQCDNPVADR